jgi:hypothetical protein
MLTAGPATFHEPGSGKAGSVENWTGGNDKRIAGATAFDVAMPAGSAIAARDPGTESSCR